MEIQPYSPGNGQVDLMKKVGIALYSTTRNDYINFSFHTSKSIHNLESYCTNFLRDQSNKVVTLLTDRDVDINQSIHDAIELMKLHDSSLFAGIGVVALVGICWKLKGKKKEEEVQIDWWNTKPNEKIKWEKVFEDIAYRYLLRNNQQNVVDNGNEYLKKLEGLMKFFGGDMRRVEKAYVLFHETLFDSFQNYRSLLFPQQGASSAEFNKDDWKDGNDSLQKFKFYDHYTKMAEAFDWNNSKSLHAIPMIHGTNKNALDKICQTGLATTGATDPGFYGQGIYFSSSLFYSSRYATDSPNGKPVGVRPLVICMVTPGNVYPVTESPYLEGPDKIENPKGFLGKSYKLGYQSHYTLVDKRKFHDAYPITGNIDGNTVNELVVFERAQVLPLFAIYYK